MLGPGDDFHFLNLPMDDRHLWLHENFLKKTLIKRGES
jgi:hypothetical protein